MKLLGPDGRFPVMFRGTHKQKVIQVSQDYRRELGHAEARQRNAENQLAREQAEWFEALDTLKGYHSDGVDYILAPYTNEDPHNIRVRELVMMYEQDSTRFFFDLTNFLINRNRAVLDSRQLRFIIGVISNQVTRLLTEALVKDKIRVKI